MLKVNNLNFRYSAAGNPVLNGACLELKQGEIGILLGKNGSGKTTLFKNILGIEAGQTTADGKFSIQDTRCLGCCGLAPVMTINEDVYGKLLPSEVKDILAKY